MKEISAGLKSLCYTEDSLISLVTRIRDSVKRMEKQESNEDIQAVEMLFTPQVRSQIAEGKIFYSDVLKMFEQSMGGKEIKQCHKSRIYYSVANAINYNDGGYR